MPIRGSGSSSSAIASPPRAPSRSPRSWSPTTATSISPRPARGRARRNRRLIFVSSGTTGKPKASLGFHGNLSGRWRRLAAWLKFGPDDVHLVHLPLAHGFGLMTAVAGLLGGGRLVLADRPTTDEIVRLIGAEGVTVFNGAPGTLPPDPGPPRPRPRRRGTPARVRRDGGDFPPPLIREIYDVLHVIFVYMYGSSEGLGVATDNPDDILRGSVGRPVPGAVAIVGPDRAASRRGRSERSPSLARSSRSATGANSIGSGRSPPRRPRPKAGTSGITRATSDAWMPTGASYVHGRLKHQIDRGGLKVDPIEVERALFGSPDVADAAVLGVPDPILGERVCA